MFGAAAVLLVAAAFSASTAFAAKGGGAQTGGKHGGSGGSTNSGTCVIAPNPLAYRTYGTLTGSGFTPNTTVGYTVQGSGGTAMGFADVDSSGHVTLGVYGGWLGTNTFTFTRGPSCSVLVQ